jgi:hypothetical protein
MTMHGRIVVTAGPTINAADIRAVVPNAEVLPPISFGEALTYGLRRADTLLVVDGLFREHAPVRHKELLTLIADGVRVVGASNVGALRAAELHPFGMEGYGSVFEAYRNGVLEADDEVRTVHGAAEDGYPVFVDALVNMRRTVAKAAEAGVVSAPMAREIIEAARRMPYAARTWDRLLAELGVPDRRRLARQLQSMRVDVQHADALLALGNILPGPRRDPVRHCPPATMWSKRWRQRSAPMTLVPIATEDGAKSDVQVADTDVLALLSVSATDRWAYRPALEQIAAWHRNRRHPREHGSVGECALRAAADVASGSYERGLEIVAHHYVMAAGLIDDSGFPEHIRAHWLTAEENARLRHDPVGASARIATRTLFFAPALPAIEYFLELLRGDPRLPEWRATTAQLLAMRNELARRKPHLDVSRPNPTQLSRLYGACWGTPADHIERASRGLMTADSFYNAGTLFAVAAARGQLPAIRVGRLGPGAPSRVPTDPVLNAGS